MRSSVYWNQITFPFYPLSPFSLPLISTPHILLSLWLYPVALIQNFAVGLWGGGKGWEDVVYTETRRENRFRKRNPRLFIFYYPFSQLFYITAFISPFPRSYSHSTPCHQPLTKHAPVVGRMMHAEGWSFSWTSHPLPVCSRFLSRSDVGWYGRSALVFLCVCVCVPRFSEQPRTDLFKYLNVQCWQVQRTILPSSTSIYRGTFM